MSDGDGPAAGASPARAGARKALLVTSPRAREKSREENVRSRVPALAAGSERRSAALTGFPWFEENP